MNDTLKNLYAVVEDRKANPQEGSYTCYLIAVGWPAEEPIAPKRKDVETLLRYI